MAIYRIDASLDLDDADGWHTEKKQRLTIYAYDGGKVWTFDHAVELDWPGHTKIVLPESRVVIYESTIPHTSMIDGRRRLYRTFFIEEGK